MSRRGTKGNPFDIGERVVLSRLRSEGTVVESKATNIGTYYERSYAPIRYRVLFDDGESGWYYARDLHSLPKLKDVFE